MSAKKSRGRTENRQKAITEGDFLGANESIGRTAKIAERVIAKGDFLANKCGKEEEAQG